MSSEGWHMIEPDGPRRVRPYQVTDGMVEAYAETVAGMDGGRASVIREGMLAALRQREIEIRQEQAASDGCLCDRAKREYCHSTKCHGGADFMTREERIAERTRDLLDEIVSVEVHPVNLDPYPATVGEVADEIARYVVELDNSGAARGLADRVMHALRRDSDA